MISFLFSAIHIMLTITGFHIVEVVEIFWPRSRNVEIADAHS